VDVGCELRPVVGSALGTDDGLAVGKDVGAMGVVLGADVRTVLGTDDGREVDNDGDTLETGGEMATGLRDGLEKENGIEVPDPPTLGEKV
jgi:hypothetical protein